jgi:RimJ/RimL family protein N-acetyltransferase
MIGQVIIRRATEHGAGKAEVGYMFLPQAWGFGYAAEACAAALGWLAGELPGEPVVLKTQTANARSMRLAAKLGFTEAGRFEAWDAEQWYGMRPPVPADRLSSCVTGTIRSSGSPLGPAFDGGEAPQVVAAQPG